MSYESDMISDGIWCQECGVVLEYIADGCRPCGYPRSCYPRCDAPKPQPKRRKRRRAGG